MQAFELLGFLGEKGIYHGEISPLSLLVTDSYEVLMGDFPLAVIKKQDSPDTKYYLRGINSSTTSN
jgi:RIO-like serine/threonine protein kinase